MMPKYTTEVDFAVGVFARAHQIDRGYVENFARAIIVGSTIGEEVVE